MIKILVMYERPVSVTTEETKRMTKPDLIHSLLLAKTFFMVFSIKGRVSLAG